jgi:hypothetical protein
MASKTLNLNHTWESPRGRSMTVAKALAWAEAHTGSEDEETGEVTNVYGAEDLICYAVSRMMTLGMDRRRRDSGHAPRTVYVADTGQVEGKTKNADAVREAAREMLAKALHIEAKPAPKAKAEPKPAPKGKAADKISANDKRIAEIQAQLAAKTAPPAKAKVPAVRKAVKTSAKHEDLQALRPVSDRIVGVEQARPTADDLLRLAAAAESAGDAATAAKLMAQALAL